MTLMRGSAGGFSIPMKKGGLGRFLLFCAVAASAAAGVYYYLNKLDADEDLPEDEDFDDPGYGSEDESVHSGSRRYVDLGRDTDETVDEDDFAGEPVKSEEYIKEDDSKPAQGD